MSADVFMVLRSALSLAVVIGLMYLLARVARRLNSKGGPVAARQSTIRVDSRVSMGKGQSIASLQWLGRSVLVGVTPQHISVLAQGEIESGQSEHPHEEAEVIDLRSNEDPFGTMITRWGEGTSSTPTNMPTALRMELKRLLGARR